MTAQHFLSCVLETNATELVARPGDYRLAVNAILSADAFFGVYSSDELNTGFESDDAVRNYVAGRCEAYRLLRDMAFSLKHGRLSRPKSPPRLVVHSSAVSQREAMWNDNGTWDDKAAWSDNVVLVHTHESENILRADVLVTENLLISRAILSGTDLPEVALRDLVSRSILS